MAAPLERVDSPLPDAPRLPKDDRGPARAVRRRPEAVGFESFNVDDALRKWLRPFWQPVARRAAEVSVAGPDLLAALDEARMLGEQGFGTAIGFWNGVDHSSQNVADEYLRSLDELAGLGLDCHLSIKPLALAFRRDLLAAVIRRARDLGMRLQFDSPAAEVADITFSAIHEAACEDADLGCTLPGRWRRSLTDANWAIARGLAIRVVKGQWADPDDPMRDPSNGFLSVIDRVAGRARRVSVATHDARLAREAIGRLRASGTPCEIELLVGQPAGRVLRTARAVDAPVRGYIPYGSGALLYRLSEAIRSPRMLRRLSRDLAGRRKQEWTRT